MLELGDALSEGTVLARQFQVALVALNQGRDERRDLVPDLGTMRAFRDERLRVPRGIEEPRRCAAETLPVGHPDFDLAVCLLARLQLAVPRELIQMFERADRPEGIPQGEPAAGLVAVDVAVPLARLLGFDGRRRLRGAVVGLEGLGTPE